jgi:signal transduction histidine kinase
MVTPVFMVGFGLVLGLSLLGFFATSRIVMPIRLLREEAQYIARGDLGRQVKVSTNDEIELLADDINLMSAKLKDIHADLEERIEERTIELSEANKRLEAQRGVLLKVNKQLMKASTLKSEFLADICEGLNNPVVNIIRLAENIAEKNGENLDDVHQEYLGDILGNAKHLHQLISEVFTIARATSGKMEMNLSSFNVEKILREVQESVRAIATEKNIRFEFEINENVGELDADINLIKNIVFNLYTNAIKYGRINGTVITESCIVDDCVEISVADTGIGIRPEDQERIFQGLKKVETPQTPYYEGTGMGLALAQRFVEMHGGRIWVESEHGKGSKFIFRIPLSQGEN